MAVARWYQEWHVRSVAGDASRPFPASEMHRRNDFALVAVGDISGPEAVTAFTDTATAYLERAVEHWDLPFEYPFGTVTVGLHCGVAAAEWHLHAWASRRLLLSVTGLENPEGLFLAAGWSGRDPIEPWKRQIARLRFWPGTAIVGDYGLAERQRACKRMEI